MRALKIGLATVFLLVLFFIFAFKIFTNVHTNNIGAAIPLFEYVTILQRNGREAQIFLLKDVVPNVNWDTVVIYSRHKQDEFFNQTLMEFFSNNQMVATGGNTLKTENDEFLLNSNQVYFKDNDNSEVSLGSPQACGKNTYLKINKHYEESNLFELLVFCDEKL